MFEKDLALPPVCRGAFKEPIGRRLDESELDSFDTQTPLVTVGDVVSLTFRKHGIRPTLSIYDGRTERRGMTDFAVLVEHEERRRVVNPAGTVTAELADAIRGCTEGSGELIEVEGEEDLALLPCMLLFPEGSRIVYGLPGVCMMLVTIDGPAVAKAEQLMSNMEETE